MKMEKNRIHRPSAALFKISDIPRGKRFPHLRAHMHHISENIRPDVQIFLVAELPILDAGIAPFQAAFLPPAKDSSGFWRVQERVELHAKPAVPGRLVVLRRVCVLRNEHVFASPGEFVQEHSWIIKEEQIRIKIGNPRQAWIQLENKLRKERSNSPAILANRARRANLPKAECLHCSQRD